MSAVSNKPASTARVVLAFAIVYIVWGSTYFFIRQAVLQIPPMLVGAFRFLTAGAIMLVWCLARGEKIFVWRDMRPAIVSGLLLLFFGNGALIWSEQFLNSSLAAILLAANPIWFVLLDRRMWPENFRSVKTIIGLLVGFAGVGLLFGEQLMKSVSGSGGNASLPAGYTGSHWHVIAILVLVLGSISWASGSLYAKYKSTGKSNAVNSGWQMFAAGLVFLPASWIRGEWAHFHPQEVGFYSWFSVFYLVTMGSLLGYSAFVWLLQVRSATQVSTHAYVNPVVAVLLGVLFASEKMSLMQLLGLTVILVSVLLINLAKNKKAGAGAKDRAVAGGRAADTDRTTNRIGKRLFFSKGIFR